MQGEETGQAALDEFSEKATFVLHRRIDNSPKERGEDRWKANWTNRCATYKNQ